MQQHFFNVRVQHWLALVRQAVPAQHLQQVLAFVADRGIDDCFFKLREQEAGGVARGAKCVDYFGKLLVVQIISSPMELDLERLPNRMPPKIVFLQHQDLCQVH